MKYKTIQLIETDNRSLATELTFELAVARADGVELLKVSLPCGIDDTYKKIATLTKLLRGMKDAKKIQFFATHENFRSSSTEAVFLINKYPEIFENMQENEDTFIYVKL